MYLKDNYIKAIVDIFPKIAAMQTDEGQFINIETKKYTVYSQYGGFYFAFLHTCNKPCNSYYQSPEVLNRAVNAWDFYHSQTNEEGWVKIITYDQFWGYHCDEWGLYYWMETTELLKDVLPLEKLQKWQERIANGIKSLAAIIKETAESKKHQEDLKNGSVRNHFVWEVLCCYRYGMLKSDQALMDLCTGMMEDILDHQNTLGAWLEGGSPVVSYAFVSLSAISLYEAYSGNKRATEAIKKSLDFAYNTIYPDFTRIGCLDGRNRYSPSLGAHLVPTYYKYEAGLAYLCKWITCTGKINEMLGSSTHSLVSVCDIARIIPEETTFTEPDIKKYIPPVTDNAELKYHVLREGQWVIPFCCLEQVTFDNRFVLYRQNLFSIFHERTGELVGGGHSISQPQFSCFNVISGPQMHYIHEDSSIQRKPDGMNLVYGGKKCKIEFIELSKENVTVKYSIEGLADVDRANVNIPLYGSRRSSIIIDNEELHCHESYITRKITSNSRFAYRSIEMSLSEDAIFNYPVIPYNSYMQNQKNAPTEVFGIITVELDYMKPECTLKLKV